MELAPELYETPASSLDTFVARWVQPTQEWKEGVLEAGGTVEKFLREERFQWEHGLDQEVRMLKVLKVGSLGNGTGLRSCSEVELVVFPSCFRSFREGASLHQAILHLIRKRAQRSRDLQAVGLESASVVQGVPDALIFTFWSWRMQEPITVSIVPAYRALGPSVTNTQPPHPAVYDDLIKAKGNPGHFSPSFCELQRNFVKHRPTKLKSLMRLVKHWYLQYVKARSPRATLPPLYALELLTVYAWEMGAEEEESFPLHEGLATVMELLQNYQFLCIYWTKFYSLEDPVLGDFVRKKLKGERPIILDPADPTHNVAEGYRWDIVAQRASHCLKQDCCYDDKDNPIPSWNVKSARDIQVTVELSGYPDLILWVNPYDPITKIIKKIRLRRSRRSSVQLRLSFQEPGGERKGLAAQCSLAYYGIFASVHLLLLETVPPERQVFVKNLHGESQAYAIHPNSFIGNLKQQIELRQGLLQTQQELEFQGQVLQDWLSVGNYGIQDNNTLILSKKRAGGEAPLPFS
ncbi:2'-5'-oligoadenylate synthase-like protein [Sorex fumeus]|uniref:2'-5'-oligoadenylate synthase-like protein n=1 Tax=Sorex fumeus TaxID=62283 RepID=UPI0024AE46D9|nr:2'-5'-oligoadenylate synthase-like protein [Sorex fumeus]